MEWTATQLATRPSYTAKWVGSTQLLLLLLPRQLLPVFEVGAGVGGMRLVGGGGGGGAVCLSVFGSVLCVVAAVVVVVVVAQGGWGWGGGFADKGCARVRVSIVLLEGFSLFTWRLVGFMSLSLFVFFICCCSVVFVVAAGCSVLVVTLGGGGEVNHQIKTGVGGQSVTTTLSRYQNQCINHLPKSCSPQINRQTNDKQTDKQMPYNQWRETYLLPRNAHAPEAQGLVGFAVGRRYVGKQHGQDARRHQDVHVILGNRRPWVHRLKQDVHAISTRQVARGCV